MEPSRICVSSTDRLPLAEWEMPVGNPVMMQRSTINPPPEPKRIPVVPPVPTLLIARPRSMTSAPAGAVTLTPIAGAAPPSTEMPA